MIPPMPRLARHAFTALSALSLLLCAAVCLLMESDQRSLNVVVLLNARSLRFSVAGA